MHKYELFLYCTDQDPVFVAGVPELPCCMASGDEQDAALG